jgi:predicted nucleotidyltransferase
MDRATVLQRLAEHREEMRRRFGAERLALFGSAARDELRESSDIDVLVSFDGAPGFDRYFELKSFLERLLGRPVDLVTETGLKQRARLQVEKDLIRVP